MSRSTTPTLTRVYLGIAALGALVLSACSHQPRPDPAALPPAIARGLAYVCAQQLPHGEFPAPFLHRVDGHLTNGPAMYSPNVFCTGVMLYSLAIQAEFRASPNAERALDFLEGLVQSNGTWQFYTPASKRYAVFIPDVDDTAIISLALGVLDRKPPKNVAVLLHNALPDGALQTWIYPPGFPVQETYDNRTSDEHFSIRTPDPVVNAHALAYLAYRQVEAPQLCDYLNRVAKSGRAFEDSTYYLHLTSAAYAYAKALRCGAICLEDAVDTLGRHLLEQRPATGMWDTAQQAALALNAWLAMREVPAEVHETAAQLLATQHEDGSWPADIYFGSKRIPNRGWGSPALTTAFAVEALTRYQAYVNAR